MFDRVAPRYDLVNAVLSLGQDRHWRRVAVAAAAPQPGQLIVDVAAGTGALAAGLIEAGREQEGGGAGPRVLAADLSHRMLSVGASRWRKGPRPWWCNADGLELPLADACADAVVVGFGLRNLPDPQAGLAELARVTRSGGRLVVLEFSQPPAQPLRAWYQGYLRGVLPRAASLFASDPPAYRYLAESIAAWPDAPTLAGTIEASGWSRVQYARLTAGIVAAHRARRL
jgi:demethylmenaquinone methyltransferase/2-methoxy-6-polyprenyl-1,4-benzoquinol methylase